MRTLHDSFVEKSYEIARKNAHIIELECQNMCAKYSCKPEDLIIQYHSDTTIEINVKGVHFKITNNFTINSDDIKDLTK